MTSGLTLHAGLTHCKLTKQLTRQMSCGWMQVKRSYRRNDKAITGAALKFLAHLTNQGVVNEMLATEVIVLMLSLENLTGTLPPWTFLDTSEWQVLSALSAMVSHSFKIQRVKRLC